MSRFLSRLTRASLLCTLVLMLPVSSIAQDPIPVQYRLTRTAPAPTATYVFPYSAMTCNLPVGMPPSTGLRISDPVNAGRDCELLGTAGGVIVPRPAGATHAYSIAGGDSTGTLWSAEAAMGNIVPPAPPTSPRLRPPLAGVALLGTIQERFPFAGLDVVRVLLDDTADAVYVGMSSLTAPGYSPRVGDRVQHIAYRLFEP